MAKEKTIDAKKIKLRYDTDLSTEDIAVLALEENTTAIARLLEKQELFENLKSFVNDNIIKEIGAQDKKDGELAGATLKILKERLGSTNYTKLCEKAKKEIQKFRKQHHQDFVGSFKDTANDVTTFINDELLSRVEGIAHVGNTLRKGTLKLGKKIYKISLKHKKDLEQLKTYSDKINQLLKDIDDDEDAKF